MFTSLSIDFLRKVLRTSLILAGISVVLSLLACSAPITLGLAIGMAISLIFFKTLCSAAERALSRGTREAGLFFLKTGILKYPLLGIAVYLIFRYLEPSPVALLAGIGLVQTVIVFKAIGAVLADRRSGSE
ncbi:MAG: ATP synthase subunit I [bacterium]